MHLTSLHALILVLLHSILATLPLQWQAFLALGGRLSERNEIIDNLSSSRISVLVTVVDKDNNGEEDN